ncbi:MAG: response regulator transcription factor [Lachnospiraceae bacterium]|nr:response regulator transcription factor [Lachnospiraceae bacterium]
MKIIVIDDDKLVALSLKTILENTGSVEVAATGGSGAEAIELYAAHKPDVVLMDIRMQGMTGLEAGEKILKADADARILYLTTFSDDEYIIKALKMGAKGYLLKQDFTGIEPALRAVMNGQCVYGDQVITRLPELMAKSTSANPSAHGLNEKEWDIVTCVARGLSNKEIATELFLGEGTVRNYISTILEKLGLRDRTQLAIFYYRNR